ncbi:MAG: HEAT repeat domain-containing protein [Planctomycetes bacterium]|jgi:quinoprotein glucose dehydrogenase|nr:HEAT repeat domain-containing protein [Planctomycetota bacterium]
MPRHRPTTLSVLALAAAAAAQHDTATDPSKRPMYVAPASSEAQEQIRGFQLQANLLCDLIAAEPDLCNAVAFAFDGKGRCYVAETFRINDGVPDTRSYMQWKDDDLACLTVADRIAKYQKHIPGDIARYAAYSERVRMLVDTDRNGTLDRSTVFATGFDTLEDGVASGVLPVGDDVWFTDIPKLWRLRDTDGDGVADERTAVHDGFGVHSSLIGHDLHGLIVGPDRRLYFSIGDRGFHVVQGERTLAYPHEGAVLRCELDGSQLEVVHRGLRNPQELAFDANGDLFTGDNNSDGGDRARLVQIVAGADSGWRIGYQWLADRGTWNREKLWEPRHPGQPAWVLPPIANFADGPSGLAFDPGIGLPARYRGCFFLCDFRGGASYSGVHALRLERSGAGYQLASTDKVIWNVLATDVDFGPDGAMYVLDWVSGWNKTGKGRIYRVRSEQAANDMLARSTAQLLGSDLKARGAPALQPLLAHADRRVRQQAQFALCDLDARDVLAATAANRDSALARQHAIWGLGSLGRRDAAAVEPLLPLLGDGDPDVRAAVARVLGDVRLPAAIAPLGERLRDGHPRVQREAALALARCGAAARGQTPAVLAMLRANDDRDAVLRHAAVFALAELGDLETLLATAGDPRPAVRRGVLLALARLGSAEVARFLRDADAELRLEAATAIHDGPIPAAMKQLALCAYDDTPDGEMFDWRAINACRRTGESEDGEALVHLASLTNHPARTRIEALDVLAEWLTPHGQCRVTGLWRPVTHTKGEIAAQNLRGSLDVLLADGVTAAAAARAAGQLGLRDAAPLLVDALANGALPVEARLQALEALAALETPELTPALASIDAAAPASLRQRAVALLSKTDPEKAVPVLATLLTNATVGEQQAALQALGDLRNPASAAELKRCLDRLQRGELAAALQLDLFEAVAKHADDVGLQSALLARRSADAEAGELGPWLASREGGDADRGRQVFHDHEATRCTRCHALGGSGGNAGPALDDIGSKLSRDQLLEALITPSARIAEGFGTTTIETSDGAMLVGVVTGEQDGNLTIVPADGKPVQVLVSKIRSRKPNSGSAMPAMGGPLDRRQVRDLIEFLSRRRKQ